MNIDLQNMPQHVAIIMDGNGRWAKQRGKLRVFGHRKGVKAVHSAVNFALTQGIKVLTLYAFSSENWSRPKLEVAALMTLFIETLDLNIKKLHSNNIRLKIIGDKTAFSEALQEKIELAEQLTNKNTALTLNIAANYGGQWDIVQATKRIAHQIKNNVIPIEDITTDYFQHNLSTEDQPQVDLLIRTSGEQRISNFLLWQIAYAELVFSPVLWPDFNEKAFTDAVIAYQQRDRRFGGC
ncbi:isoprenyl transferase [Glaesserella parasuis]|nr:isoprenyl transferase [Glaesserella parasuis]MDG6266815.1 isoprenyl transferase [Glaesserella parasuis]